MMTQNHSLPDLIWNERTRLELRIALEYEIKSFEKEQKLKGNKKVAWNFQQFSVTYDSLKNEMRVGNIYIRYLMDAEDSFFKTLENPNPLILFEKLFRRILVSRDENSVLSIVCCRAIIRLYTVCIDNIGIFDDMLLIVKMINDANNIELKHCLLDLLELLSSEENNLIQLLDESFVDTIIKYASLAHLNPDQIGNVLARLTNSVLTLKNEDNYLSSPNNDNNTNNSSSINNQNNNTTHNNNSQKNTDPKKIKHKKNSSLGPGSYWIPDDLSCPRVWFVAPPVPQGGSALPPIELQKGPYRVSELKEMHDR